MKALSRKNILIIAASALAAVIISIIIVFILTRPESYRVLKSFEMTGTSSVERKDIGHLDVYVGMNFENEDVISTDKESSLRLALDSDKYVLLDELTVMELVAAGNQSDSRTILKLREGNILNEITKPLSENSSYVVNAPKSTMAVRGTSFNVNVKQLEDGSYITDVDVIHGHVDVQLLDENGEEKGDLVVVTEGNRVTIMTDPNEETSNDPDIDGNSYFVFHGIDESGEPTLFTYDTENTPVYPSDYLMLPEKVKETIIDSNDSGLLVLNESIAQKVKEETNTAEAEIPAETTSAAAVPLIADNVPAETTAPAVSEVSLPAETEVPEVTEREPVPASEETYTEAETSVSETEAETSVSETETEITATETEQETTVSETETEITATETEPEIVTVFTTAETSPYIPQYTPAPSTTTETTTSVTTETTTSATTETTAPVSTEETSETTTETTEPLPETYTISFETSEAGVTMPESITAEAGETVSLPAVPEKTGYTGHWEVNGEEVTSVTVEGDITVTAVYEINSYNITYTSNIEGVNFSPAAAYFQYGINLKSILPVLPKVEGYTGEWQINGKAVPDDYIVSEDITVTAFYTINTYTVTFDSEIKTSEKAADYGTKLPEIPEKTGYTGKWTLDGEEIPDGYTVTADVTVTAEYTINSYTVTFNADGETSEKTAEHGTKLADILPDVPEKTGHTGKWTLDGKEIPDGYTVTEDVTITAEYTPISYSITFTSEEDVELPENTEADYGTEYELPAVPEKTGHDGHWEIDGETVTSFTVEGDITVEAVYTVQKYPVIFDYALDDEAIISEDRVTGEFEKDFELEYGSRISEYVSENTAKPEISGYEFDHWLYNGETFSETDTVKVPDENGITLTAVYKRTGYVITYHYLKDSTDIKTQVIPIGEPMQIEYSSGTGAWIYEDDQGKYHEQYDGHSVSSDLDMYEGITISVDEVSWSNNGSTGKDEFARYYSGSELIKKYGDTITETELDMLQNVYNSRYYVVNDRISDISPYPNTDTVLTAEDLKSVEATKSIYIVPVLRFNYNGTVYNYFGALRNSNKNYDAFLDSLGTPEDGEEWCIEPNGSTVMQQSFFKYGSEFSVFAGEIGYNNEPLTLSIKKPAAVTFNTNSDFYGDTFKSTVTMGDGETFGSVLPPVTNGSTWVYENENGTYSKFTDDTPVYDGMEIYNGISIAIMGIMNGAGSEFALRDIIYIPSYFYLNNNPDSITKPEGNFIYAYQSFGPDNNNFDWSEDGTKNYTDDITSVNILESDIILYEATHIINVHRYNDEYTTHTYLMNSDYDSDPTHWLPQATDGFKWRGEQSGNTEYTYEEISATQGTSGESTGPQVSSSPALSGNGPVEMENGAPVDEEDDTGSSVSLDAAEPTKPEDIPEPSETPDDTGNGE